MTSDEWTERFRDADLSAFKAAANRYFDMPVTGQVMRQEAHVREERTIKAIRSHDFDAAPILDLVWVYPEVPSLARDELDTPGVYLTPTLRTRSYGRKAPPIEGSAVEGKRCEIQRVTRPLLERLMDEYPTVRQKLEADP